MTTPDPVLQRLHALDILRGFALLGMFVVHFHARSSEPGGVDDVVRTLIWRLVESKSHGTFALLFGAGFAVQLRRYESRRLPIAAIYLRRLAILALFGFAAHALFGFNVLLGYAVWGVPLLLVRKWSTRALLVTAVVSALSVTLYLRASTWLTCEFRADCLAAAADARRAEAVAVNGALEAAERQSRYFVLLGARLRHMAWFHVQPFFVMPGATLTLFIVGFLLVRHRIFDAPASHRWLLLTLAGFGIVSWASDNWLLPTGFGLIRDQWLTFTYVAVALLVVSRAPGLVARLRPVAAAGRMALTNYLLQIAALDLIFSGYALDVVQVRPIVGLASAVAAFCVEAAVSTVWLARFHFGPAEWLWRWGTYGQRPPMRRLTRSMVPESVSV